MVFLIDEIQIISIHVLRVEDDEMTAAQQYGYLPFQSTSSVWRTTMMILFLTVVSKISIHVLRVEDDPKRAESCSTG